MPNGARWAALGLNAPGKVVPSRYADDPGEPSRASRTVG